MSDTCRQCLIHWQVGKELAPDGYYCDNHVWIRVVFGVRTELHGTAPHPQEVGIK